MIGTSQTYGWRDEVETREAVEHTLNQFVTAVVREGLRHRRGRRSLSHTTAGTGVVVAVAKAADRTATTTTDPEDSPPGRTPEGRSTR